MNAHRQSIKDKKETLVAMHFNGACSLDHFSVQPIELISDGRNEKSTKQRKLRASYWIKNLARFTHMALTIVAMHKTGTIKMTIVLHPQFLIKH